MRRVFPGAVALVLVSSGACGLTQMGSGAPEDASSDAAPADVAGDPTVDDALADDAGDDAPDAAPPRDAAPDACASCPPGFACAAGVCADDARAHFSTTTNPSGNWTWAFHLPEAGAGTVPYPTFFTDNTQMGVEVWSRAAGSWTPAVFYNPSDAAVHPYGTLTVDPGELAFHPGPLDENSVVRWTAPTARTYRATVNLRGLSGWNDAQPTSTGVTVLAKNAVLATVQITGPLAPPINVPPAAFAAGETIDVRVDFGQDGNYGFDSTGVDVHVVAP